MKKNFLTAMLFFAFFVVSFQASAQYVNNDVATNLLMTEMQATADNPIYAEQQEKNAQYAYLNNKVKLYNHVYELIEGGVTVENAIEEGVSIFSTSNTSNGAWTQSTPSTKNPNLTPLHQELVDLLEQ